MKKLKGILPLILIALVLSSAFTSIASSKRVGEYYRGVDPTTGILLSEHYENVTCEPDVTMNCALLYNSQKYFDTSY